MHKNPFATAPAPYTPHQPPLPPGPPPPQPTQQDYSAYWAAAAAQAQQPGAAAYNPQWSAPQPAAAAPPRPPPEQSALYANYGYGGQQNYQWQQQQRQQHFQPPPPIVQPPPPPPQPAYTPYQPQASTFQQPYVPQAAAPPQQAAYTPQMPSMQTYQQPPQPFMPQQQQNRQNNRPPPQHSPQQPPPAKRQRFDGPNQHRGPQNQFQPPPPPGGLGGGVGLGMNAYGPNQGGHGRGGAPGANQVPLGSGRGGFGGGRGGNNQGGRGRGGNMGMSRGGGRGGRGGSMYGNMGGRGGGPGQGGNFRGHGSNRGFGNNRRGGSFNAGSGPNFGHGHQQNQQQHHHHHQNLSSQGSFRGRNQGFNSGRSGRHDSSPNHSARDGAAVSTGSSSGKKDENRRTLTDFKIIALELEDLSWSWGTVRKTSDNNIPVKEEGNDTKVSALQSEEQAVEQKPVPDADVSASEQPSTEGEATVKSEPSAPVLPPPPSRIRIYFHTPVTADDSTVSPQSSVAMMSSSSNVRKGKRKKIEDEDGESEDGRGPPPPPPQHSSLEDPSQSGDYDGTDTVAERDSVAPSVAETASEGDWLMAAIGEDEGEGDGEHVPPSELDNLHDVDAEGEPDDYGNDYDGDIHQDLGPDQTNFGGAGDEHVENPLAHDDDSVPPGLGGPNGHVHEPVSGAPTVNGHDGNGSVPSDAPIAEESQSVPTSAIVPTNAADSSSIAEHSAKSAELPPPNVDSNQNDSMQISDPSSPPGLHGIPADVEPNGASSHVSSPPGHAGQHDQPEGDPEYFEATQPVDQLWDEHAPHPEHPPSPSGTAAPLPGGEETGSLTDKPAAKSDRTPSANRLSISYAAGTRRLVIDASIVQALKVYRVEGRIEVQLTISKENDHFKGIVMEGLTDSSTSYTPLELNESSVEDPTIPPFTKAELPLKTTLIAYLDTDRPLSEPRWVKSGDVHDWLRSMFGRMFWVAGEAADGWEKKIEVVDPDPPPTIWTVLEAWAVNSNVGLPNERQRFLRTHMTETDNILEILLRLVRGERASYSQSQPVISAPSVSGPLLSALSQGSSHGAQQTHVSLAVLAIFRLAVEYAKKSLGDTGKGDAEARVGEIIRYLPSHLIYKSLDGIFKEWRVEKKGGRAQ